MGPDSALDKFQRREIEQRLAADLQATSERSRRASSDEEKRTAAETHIRALARFTAFVTKGIVPEDLRPPESSPGESTNI
jgi:hypothetical protein